MAGNEKTATELHLDDSQSDDLQSAGVDAHSTADLVRGLEALMFSYLDSGNDEFLGMTVSDDLRELLHEWRHR